MANRTSFDSFEGVRSAAPMLPAALAMGTRRKSRFAFVAILSPRPTGFRRFLPFSTDSNRPVPKPPKTAAIVVQVGV
jgi:hypothetical protein